MQQQQQIPEGYMKNAQGHLIPVDMVSDVDKLRDETVKEIFGVAIDTAAALQNAKREMMDSVQAFVDLSAEKYGVAIGGKKGNIQLTSFDGKYKVLLAVADRIEFDERLQVAKALIDECIAEWSEGSRDEIKVLINDAFQTDKAGKLNSGRILGLRRHDIQHPKWKQAMQAISDSVQVTGSKEYIRVYAREKDGAYKQIPLDLAAV